ncbi:hypothetical protein [Nocardiopsis alba]|uniref:hypothetical protein n=1 Tax=Nocardiopsis alba TaxID=53437 RepID=UPI003D75980D
MTELPYTYTDFDYDTIKIADGELKATDTARGVSVVVGLLDSPTDVVDLACAILAANGHTGHTVVSRETIDETFAAGRQIGAQLMRDRAMRAASDAPGTPHTPAEAIRALPPIPDAAPNAVVHMDGPEGVTPCGSGTHDVTAAVQADQVTCIACLRVVAQARAHLDPVDSVEPGDEVPALAEIADRVAALEERLSPPVGLNVRIDKASVSNAARDLSAIRERASAEAKLRAVRDTAYDEGHADGLRMGNARSEWSGDAPRDPDLRQQVRALVKRYGAPHVAYEAARQATF